MKPFRKVALSLAGMLEVVIAAAVAGATPNPAGLDLFEKKIRPVLISECFKCHSSSAEKLKGGLLLDSQEGMLAGGDSGPAVVPGNAVNSLIIKAIRGVDKDLSMPPKKKLGDDVIADFTQWVTLGAPWPVDKGAKPVVMSPAAKYEALRKELWSWQPVKAVTPPEVKVTTALAAWSKSDIDRFVLAKLDENGLQPSPAADKGTLLRRATFDLTGLPPTPAEVDAFVKDVSPDAFAKVVDRLLASPRFGERWGRHWLDVARYAESTGMARNFIYQYAWRYRDYVINAFNKDKPYNRFLTEQLAGDLLPFETPQQHDEQLIATGFLAIGPKDYNEKNQQQFVMNCVDEQIDATMRGMLGTTVACARCHDHKFDPIPTAEYYSIAGIFKSTEELPGLDNLKPRLDKYSNDKYLHLTGFTEEEIKDAGGGGYNVLQNPKTTPAVRQATLAVIRAKINNPPATPPKHIAMGAHDRPFPADARVLARGEVDHPGAFVSRGFLSITCIASPPKIGPRESGRRELAQWITDPSNPLTARVMANRIWEHLFGQGIVKSVDNFGSSGEKPSHPELLDYLATQFVKDGWSVKKTIRQVMLSSAYQQSSNFDKAKFSIDPDNTFVWRMNQRRLEAEAIRDAILAASNKLNVAPPAGSVAMNLPEVPVDFLARFNKTPESLAMPNRRSVYLPVFRSDVPSVLEVFDMADPNVVDGHRDVTTVAPQALFMMNSALVLTESKNMVERISNSGAATDLDRINLAYKLTLGRIATPAERERALTYLGATARDALGRGGDRTAAVTTSWASLCQALFACAEFRYVN